MKPVKSALLLQKGQDIPVELLCMLDDHHVAGVGIEQEPGPCDVLCQEAAVLEGYPWVELPMNYIKAHQRDVAGESLLWLMRM